MAIDKANLQACDEYVNGFVLSLIENNEWEKPC
jgi:hypothetical protein